MTSLFKNKFISKMMAVCLVAVIVMGSNGMNVFAQIGGNNNAKDWQELSGASARYTITTSASEGGSITTTCTVAEGSDKTINISINEGYEISSFKVDGVDTEIRDNKYTFTSVDANHSVVVSFKKKTFAMDINVTGNGKITGAKSVEYGSISVYTFIPATGYEVADVVIDGEHVVLSEDNTYTFTDVRESHSISATFEEIICYVSLTDAFIGEYTVKCGSKTVEDGDILDYGSIIRLENKPVECYTFVYYDINGEHVTTGSYKVTGPVDITAVFTEKIYNISSTVSSNGSVSFGGVTTVAAGEEVVIETHPDRGYEVESMVVNGEDVTDLIIDNTYSTSDTWYGLNVSVKFRKIKYTIETSCSEGGTVSPTVVVEYDNNVVVSFSPEEGYEIGQLYVDGVPVENPGPDYSFNDVNESHTVYVVYSVISYSVNVNSGENGYATASEVIDYGRNYVLECFPDEGYQVDKVLVNGVPVNLRNNKYTITGIKKDFDITVSFKENEISKVKLKSVTSAAYYSISVVWDSVDKAQGYEVFRMSETENEYKLLKRVQVSYGNQKYVDTGLTPGKVYYYKIRAYKMSNGEYLYGSMSEEMSAYPKPGKVSITGITTEGVSALTVNWKRIAGVSGYELYVSSNKNGKYVLLAQLSGSKSIKYRHIKCQKGKTYYYKVRAYRNVSGEKVYGDFGAVKSGTTSCIDTVSGVKAKKVGYDYVLISWKPVSGADGYEIMWCAAKHGKYEKMAALNKTKSTYRDKFYLPGCNYYKIRAYRYVNGKKQYSSLSDVCGAYVTIRK